ncbi:hypothetical protein [Saccharopolyspora sp. NPDC002376]
MTMPEVPPGHAPVPATLHTEVAAVRNRLDELARTGGIPARPSGEWTDANNGAGTVITHTGTGSAGYVGTKITDIGVVLGTPKGCSMSSGTFTALVGGQWLLNVTVQFQGGNDAVRVMYLGRSSAGSNPAGIRYGRIGGASMDALATSWQLRLAPGEQVSVYVACWTLNRSVTIHREMSNNFAATWLGP